MFRRKISGANLKKFFFFVFYIASFLLSSLPCRGAGKGAMDEILAAIGTFSPTHEVTLIQKYPVVEEPLKPWVPEYPWEDLGLSTLSQWSYDLSGEGLSLYRKTADILSQEIKNSADPLRMQKEYLVADLLFNVALNSSAKEASQSWNDAFQAYENAAEHFPESPYHLKAQYHLALIDLEKKRYIDCLKRVRQYENVWSREPSWASSFRSLIMETYYRRKRYLRAEDYMWSLAETINRHELTEHMALRYGDSLFWQKKYAKAEEWYQKVAATFLENPQSPVAKVSLLYRAESLFQIGKIEQARLLYEKFQSLYTEPYSRDFIEYRLLQCQAQSELDREKLINEFRAFAERMKSAGSRTTLEIMARLQWMRLALKYDLVELYPRVRFELQKIQLDYPNRQQGPYREATLLTSFLALRQNQFENALSKIEDLLPFHFVLAGEDPLIKDVSGLIGSLLLDVAPDYWKRKDYVKFLVLCERFRQAIDASPEKYEIMIWMGRGYVDGGMSEEGARFFYKILAEAEGKDFRRRRVLLELAKTYAIMGEVRKADMILEFFQGAPANSEERSLYHTARALSFEAKKKYGECADEIQSLLSAGIRGDIFFPAIVQGAACARKAKQFGKADQFLTLLQGDDDIVLREEVDTERIQLAVAQENYADAVQRFEAMRAAAPDFKPPLETILALMDAYRHEGQSDRGDVLWKEYSDRNTSIPEPTKNQLREVFQTLGQADLLLQGIGNH